MMRFGGHPGPQKAKAYYRKESEESLQTLPQLAYGKVRWIVIPLGNPPAPSGLWVTGFGLWRLWVMGGYGL